MEPVEPVAEVSLFRRLEGFWAKHHNATIECFDCKATQEISTAAHSTGTVGPNLYQKKPPLSRIIDRVENGKPPMPPFKGQLTDKQIADVAAFVLKSTHGS